MSALSNYLRLTVMLREQRKARSLTQLNVSLAVGVNHRTIVRWEAGETVPDAMQLFRWSSVVGLEITTNLAHPNEKAT